MKHCKDIKCLRDLDSGPVSPIEEYDWLSSWVDCCIKRKLLADAKFRQHVTFLCAMNPDPLDWGKAMRNYLLFELPDEETLTVPVNDGSGVSFNALEMEYVRYTELLPIVEGLLRQAITRRAA